MKLKDLFIIYTRRSLQCLVLAIVESPSPGNIEPMSCSFFKNRGNLIPLCCIYFHSHQLVRVEPIDKQSIPIDRKMGALCLHIPTSSCCILMKKNKKEQTGKSPKAHLPTTTHLIKITPLASENNIDSQSC